MGHHDRKKVAVLGGGCGALAAAWTLTQLPKARERFEITVYQMGWRLGGKGASGRNAAFGQRIEEHGLHVWAGFYENAFRVMQDAYGSLQPAPENPIKTWQDAFKKHSDVMVQEHVNGKWIAWPLEIPENSDVPGTGGELPSIWAYLQMIIGWIKEELHGTLGADDGGTLAQHLHQLTASHDGATPLGVRRKLADGAAHRPVAVAQQSASGIAHVAHTFISWLEEPVKHFAEDHADLLFLFEHGIGALREEVYDKIEENNALRRLWITVDLAYAIARGVVSNGVLIHGWEAVNDRDWIDWLRCHGADDITLESAMVRGIYDYVFGYEHGDHTKPSLEAGTATHGVMRLMFTYKGALFWEMQAGMGDIVFAPLYTALKQRGVNFKFFHKVTGLHLSNSKQRVESIDLLEQATTKSGEYDPLVDVNGVPSWPSRPQFDQLEQGEELKSRDINLESAWADWKGKPVTLKHGADFDDVVLGISIAGVRLVAQELADAHDPFKQMLERVKTVQTAGTQLWIDKDAAGIGAPVPARVVSAYAQLLNTWSDMTFLLPREAWSGSERPKFIAYFCSQFPDAAEIPPFTDHGFPARELERYKKTVAGWLSEHVGHIWADATTPGSSTALDYGLLHAANGVSDQERFDSQFFRVNIDPTERYVMSVPDSSRYRLRAGQSGFHNVYLAGDWVKTSINAGCVEAAVMGGMEAAAALSGDDVHIVGGLK